MATDTLAVLLRQDIHSMTLEQLEVIDFDKLREEVEPGSVEYVTLLVMQARHDILKRSGIDAARKWRESLCDLQRRTTEPVTVEIEPYERRTVPITVEYISLDNKSE